LKQCAANNLFYSIGYTVKYWVVLPTRGEAGSTIPNCQKIRGQKPTVRKEKF